MIFSRAGEKRSLAKEEGFSDSKAVLRIPPHGIQEKGVVPQKQPFTILVTPQAPTAGQT